MVRKLYIFQKMSFVLLVLSHVCFLIANWCPTWNFTLCEITAKLTLHQENDIKKIKIILSHHRSLPGQKNRIHQSIHTIYHCQIDRTKQALQQVKNSLKSDVSPHLTSQFVSSSNLYFII
jgi:hypothetical protein